MHYLIELAGTCLRTSVATRHAPESEHARTRRTHRAGASAGARGRWLATDTAIPRASFRSIDVWHRGAWVSVDDVIDEELA